MTFLLLLFLTFALFGVTRAALEASDSDSSQLDRAADVTFAHRGSAPAEIYWLDASGQRVHLQTIQPGAQYTARSFVGHRFDVLDQSNHLLHSFAVSGRPNELFEVRDQKRSINECAVDDDGSVEQWNGGKCAWRADEAKRIGARIDAHRQAYAARLANERSRLYLNREQPNKVPKFTEVGFEVRRVPDELLSAINSFWAENKHRRRTEAWDLGNSYVNHWEIAPTMCYLSQDMKQRTWATLKPLLEEWIGGTPLEPTACYGIRLYHRGARLENHVDRLDTHAVSAIINVAQDVDEEWPLEIYNNTDHKHKVIIKPGDMVFYESASRIHGRPTPLNGRYYANYFVHFRPLDWNWK